MIIASITLKAVFLAFPRAWAALFWNGDNSKGVSSGQERGTGSRVRRG
jgi:hypothetical protein